MVIFFGDVCPCRKSPAQSRVHWDVARPSEPFRYPQMLPCHPVGNRPLYGRATSRCTRRRADGSRQDDKQDGSVFKTAGIKTTPAGFTFETTGSSFKTTGAKSILAGLTFKTTGTKTTPAGLTFETTGASFETTGATTTLAGLFFETTRATIEPDPRGRLLSDGFL